MGAFSSKEVVFIPFWRVMRWRESYYRLWERFSLFWMHSSLAGFIFYKGRNYLVVWGPISDRRRAEFTCWVSLLVVGMSFLKKGQLLNCWQFIFFIWVKPTCWSVAYPVLCRFSILPDLNFQQIEHIYHSCVF